MRQVEKYYSFYIPALNRAYPFKRTNSILEVMLKDTDVIELGRNNLHVVFPKEYNVVNYKATPMHSEAKWLVSASVKDWEK
jgi:hypothetical protein